MLLFYVCTWLWSLTLKRKQKRRKRQLPQQFTELQLQLQLASSEVEYYKEEVEQLRAQRTELLNKIWWFEKHGLLCEKKKEQLSKIEKKLHAVELKMTKAELLKMKTERKIRECLSGKMQK